MLIQLAKLSRNRELIHLHIYYLLGIIIIGLGLRYVSRGFAYKSKPRVINGSAMVMIGIAQFLRGKPVIGIAVILLGLVLFFISLIMLKNEQRN